MKQKFSKTKKQKLYKMKGCSKRKKRCVKKYRGGNTPASIYPNNGPPILRTNGIVMNSTKGGGRMSGGTCPLTQSGGLASSYPNGLVGSEWKPDFQWPTTSSGGNNHYPLNTYQNDVTRQIVLSGSNPPFSVGGRRKRRNKTQKKAQKGGTYSNFLHTDIANIGRQISYGLDTTYKGLLGLPGPVDPLPWKGQLVSPRNVISL